MLEEAIGVIRELWRGEMVDHEGRYYRVVDAQLFTVPEEPPPVYVAAAGPMAAALAGRLGDGLIGTSPEAETLETFEREGGSGKPRIGQLSVCWASDEPRAIETAMRWWPTAALRGELMQELPLPRHFEQAVSTVSQEQVEEAVVCGSDPDKHAEAVDRYVAAGYDQVVIHQVGPDQDGGLRFYADEVLPKLQ